MAVNSRDQQIARNLKHLRKEHAVWYGVDDRLFFRVENLPVSR